ncbi:AcrR family transcriptional regulator [Amorphus suaedae]
MSSQKSTPATDAAAKTAKAPARKRGRARVAALQKAGAEVFAETGYEAATMTGIAARAGASIGSLYQFFPDKEQLAAAIHGAALEDLVARIDALVSVCSGRSPAETSDRLFAAFDAFLDDHPAFAVLGDRKTIDPAAKTQARARLRSVLSALFASVSPEVPEPRRPALAAVALQLMRLVAIMRTDDDPAIRKTAGHELNRMFRRHLEEAAGVGSDSAV